MDWSIGYASTQFDFIQRDLELLDLAAMFVGLGHAYDPDAAITEVSAVLDDFAFDVPPADRKRKGDGADGGHYLIRAPFPFLFFLFLHLAAAVRALQGIDLVHPPHEIIAYFTLPNEITKYLTEPA